MKTTVLQISLCIPGQRWLDENDLTEAGYTYFHDHHRYLYPREQGPCGGDTSLMVPVSYL